MRTEERLKVIYLHNVITKFQTVIMTIAIIIRHYWSAIHFIVCDVM